MGPLVTDLVRAAFLSAICARTIQHIQVDQFEHNGAEAGARTAGKRPGLGCPPFSDESSLHRRPAPRLSDEECTFPHDNACQCRSKGAKYDRKPVHNDHIRVGEATVNLASHLLAHDTIRLQAVAADWKAAEAWRSAGLLVKGFIAGRAIRDAADPAAA